MSARDTPTLKRVTRLDCIRLDKDDRTYFTAEGYLVDHPVLTSCGIFEYVNPDGSIRRELRLPEHVFNEKSLKSYRGKPVIITHDAGTIDKDNVDKEQIGTILSDAYQDGNDVRAEIIIHNTDAMKDSGLKELSLGYTLDLIETPGTWHGESYDAIQTNIIINHLALVADARAGKKARLNIDGSDGPALKGGKKMEKDIQLTPEELEKAIADFLAKKSNTSAEDCDNTDSEDVTDTEENETSDNEINDDGDDEDEVSDRQDDDSIITKIIEFLESLKNESKDNSDSSDETECDGDEEVTDSDDEKENKSINADSADELFRQRLSICRIGDKLHMDGLENKSIIDGKKAIIKKVLPNMRLDGKDRAYIDAAYDIAVSEAGKRKDVSYQRKQMQNAALRKDSADNGKSMAEQAREKMINRNGGNE